jgi:protein-ribulosamine 3-kinase
MGVQLPARVRAEVESALLQAAGAPVRIGGAQPVGGGCVSPAARLTLDDGRSCFLKWGAGAMAPELFREEARALAAIGATGAVRVPRVLAVESGWLLLEWLPVAPATQAGWAALGRALAALHRTTSARFGWSHSNFIGPLPQSNEWSASWPEFWRDRRLAPQLERSRRAGLLTPRDAAAFDRLFERWDAVLAAAAADGPSLLHGDLWNGNVVMLEHDGAALIDPSASYGHREVDLAMAALFGGFDPAFHQAYEEVWPLAGGVAARRDIYQLYYLLVHVNLFGAGYVAGTRAALDRALAGC